MIMILFFVNIYGPNTDDVAFFETYNFLGENDEENYVIDGDFHTVLDPMLDKFGGIAGSHKNAGNKF